MKPLIWIIDEEWSDYDLEVALLKKTWPEADIRFSNYDYKKDLYDFGKDADAIMCQVYANIPAETIEILTKCKIIAVYGGGYDRVDIASARKHEINVTNVSGYCAEDLADYVMAAIYGHNKPLDKFAAAISEGKWGAQAIANPPQRICNSVLHVIGFGGIGRTVAAKAVSIGMAVTSYDPNVSAEEMKKYKVMKIEWDQGLMKADYISVNVILRKDTVGIIKYKDFKKMKPSALLINTSRGKIINEKDMMRAVTEGLISGAVIDVVAEEPPSVKDPILSCSGITVTPHISYISRQSYDELKRRAAGNVITYLKGGISPDLVN